VEVAESSVCLVMKAVLLSARWAGRNRRLALAQAAKAAGDRAAAQVENAMLRDTIELLVEQLACARRRLKAANMRMPYSPAERLHILWCIEYFGIRRRQDPQVLRGGSLHGLAVAAQAAGGHWAVWPEVPGFSAPHLGGAGAAGLGDGDSEC